MFWVGKNVAVHSVALQKLLSCVHLQDTNLTKNSMDDEKVAEEGAAEQSVPVEPSLSDTPASESAQEPVEKVEQDAE